MTPAEIEEDKARWLEAHKQLQRMPHQARQWIDQQTDSEYREDMRRRLNEVRENRKSGRWQKAQK